MTDPRDIGVFCGLDVGKGEHHATGLTPAGKKVLDQRLPNSEPKLRELFDCLQARWGSVLVVVDQPASIGALPLAVARDVGCQVAYLPGLAMRRIANLYPGEAKTDARDAFVIADAARTMPHTLRQLTLHDQAVAELQMLAGFDDDLAQESTRVTNRLRGLLTQIHPALERVLGPRLDHPAVRALLERFGSPAQLRRAGRGRLVRVLRPKAPRMAERLAGDVLAALDEQTVTVPGTDAAALIIPSLSRSLSAVHDQRAVLAARIEELLEAHPLSQVLTSLPGVGVRTAARILIDVGDGSRFRTAAHLAAYAGLAPATRTSGSSIRGERPPERGNRRPNGPSTWPRSPRYATRSPGPTTTRNAARASITSPRSPAWHADASTCFSPCSATAPCINPQRPSQLDEAHRGTLLRAPAAC